MGRRRCEAADLGSASEKSLMSSSMPETASVGSEGCGATQFTIEASASFLSSSEPVARLHKKRRPQSPPDYN